MVCRHYTCVKLMIKAGEEESEGGRSNYHASVTSL